MPDHEPDNSPADRPGQDGWITLNDDAEQIQQLQDRILDDVDRCGFPRNSRFAIQLALEEAIRNAFEHGHRTLDDGEPIDISFTVDDAAVTVHVRDHGPGFTPSDVPDPTLDENLTVPRGRGLMLMRAYMSDVSYNDKGNTVTLVYRRPDGQSLPEAE